MAEPIYSETFGGLKWDAIIDCWLGGIDWSPGLHTEVAIEQLQEPLTDYLRHACLSLAWLQEREEDMRRTVARDILPVYNDAWRGKDAAITEDDLASRLELMRIKFESDGSLLLSYDAGEMFGGHVVDGQFDANRTFVGTDLVG